MREARLCLKEKLRYFRTEGFVRLRLIRKPSLVCGPSLRHLLQQQQQKQQQLLLLLLLLLLDLLCF